ncbi:MAG: SpoIIE family protein phosphatase, partial [Firmicutes bacterium]|nr:SpoIIE family protein phosphatase [Bacillota bacterium]
MRMGITDGGYGITRMEYNGREVFLAWNPIESADWTLVTMTDVEESLALAENTGRDIALMAEAAGNAINRRILTVVLIIIAAIIATAICVYFIADRRSKKITDPLGKLTHEVRGLSGGDLDHEFSIKTGDEIEELSDAFNYMTGRLKEYIIDLTAVTAEKERIGAELSVASTIQSSMLPCIFPPFPERTEFDIYATMHPAKEVGGDFYDFFMLDEEHLAFVIADVSGKGVPAALFMVIAKTLIKNHAQSGEAPNEVFTNVNAQLCENNNAEMFVTAWMGILELSTGRLTFVNAGHNPPLIKRANEDYEYLKSKAGLVLAAMEGIKYRSSEIMLEAG